MTVTLYNIPELNVERNNMIRFTSLTQRNQYLSNVLSKVFDIDSVGAKQNLWDLNIEVALYDNFRNPERLYNYAKIVQDSNNTYFYYILGWKELGSNQVSYTLQLDTLQMAFGVGGLNDLDLDVTTNPQLITREHRDRFDFTTSKALFNDVPESGDNSTPVVLTENTLQDSGSVRARLIYKNRTDSKPVAYPYVESALSVTVQGSDWIGTITSWKDGSDETQYIWDGDFHYTFGTGTPNILVTVPSTDYVFYYRNEVGVRFLRKKHKTTGIVTNLMNIPAGVDLRIKVATRNIQLLFATTGLDLVSGAPSWTYIMSNFQAINFAHTSVKSLPLWSSIDQYDAMTDRIIEVPYFNSFNKTFYEDGYGIFLPLETEHNTNFNYQFKYRPIGTFDMTKVDKLRVKYNDPKLYTSQFAPVLLNMNGMAIGLKREAYDNENGMLSIMNTGINFNYQMLTPSNFNLKINITEPYIKKDIDELRQTWQVNNEIASIKDEAYTYNQYYKDLDDKQRNVKESAATRNAYLNTLNQSLGIVGGMIAGGTPNPVQLAARAGQAGINIAQTFMDLSDQMKLNKIQAEQKYIGLLLSASQISGGTLNFIKTFNGDKIREVQFGLRGHELDYWDNYFHKFGYEALDFKPIRFWTRKYFNHIKAILDFKKKHFGLTSAAVQDIKNRFSEGVTVFHAIGSGAGIEINFAQDKENWEL